MNGKSLFAALAAPVTFAIAIPQALPAECPRTLASGTSLGKPFPESENWFGSEALAVILPADGIWWGMGPQYHYRNKLFWWSTGFRPGMESNLIVKGKRLDGKSPPADITTASSA